MGRQTVPVVHIRVREDGMRHRRGRHAKTKPASPHHGTF
jgi:hypothetical protein